MCRGCGGISTVIVSADKYDFSTDEVDQKIRLPFPARFESRIRVSINGKLKNGVLMVCMRCDGRGTVVE